MAGGLTWALGIMINKLSVSKAIQIGLLWVNGPVLVLLVVPFPLFIVIEKHGFIPRAYEWIGLVIFLASFILAWLWWSVTVPKWRLWAYRRVENIAELKIAAVAVGLTWPDGHAFSRTEIKSQAHSTTEQELDPESDSSAAQPGVQADRP